MTTSFNTEIEKVVEAYRQFLEIQVAYVNVLSDLRSSATAVAEVSERAHEAWTAWDQLDTALRERMRRAACALETP